MKRTITITDRDGTRTVYPLPREIPAPLAYALLAGLALLTIVITNAVACGVEELAILTHGWLS